MVAYASIHGNTAAAARKWLEILGEKKAKKVAVMVCQEMICLEAIEDAFKYDKLVVAAATMITEYFHVWKTS